MVMSVSYNEWAPNVNEFRYLTNGGFVPDTTRHAFFWTAGTVASFETAMKFDRLASLETVIKSLGFI